VDQAAANASRRRSAVGRRGVHEIKYDGYGMHSRIAGRDIKLLTRTGLDWSHRYRRTNEALREIKVKSAYLDGELCALNADGVPVFSRPQAAMDEGRTDQLVLFSFDLLFLDGQSTAQLSLVQRKEKLKRLFRKKICRPAVQRACRGCRSPLSRPRLQARSRRCHLKTGGSPLRSKRPRDLGQVEVPEPRGVHRRGLDRCLSLKYSMAPWPISVLFDVLFFPLQD